MKSIKSEQTASYVFGEISVWRTRLPKTEFAVLPPSNNRPNPLVTETRVYISAFSPGAVFALERQSGKLIWRRSIPKYGGSAVYLSHAMLLAQTATTVHALEPETGRSLWSFSPGQTSSGETIYSQPTMSGNSVFVGDRRGFLHCLDSRTGQTRWKIATSRAKNRSVNSTPLVLKGLVIVSTNAKRVVAFSKETGEQVWATKLDGPAGFGPLLYKNLLAAVTNSIYLIDPESGKIVRRFTWNSYNIRQAESADRNIVVSLSRDSPYDKPKIVGLNKSGIRFAHVCRAFVEGIRYISETGLIYVSHGQGIEVRHHETGELAFNIEGKGDEWGYGPVDVKQNTIYALTDDGYVYALRHPPT